MSQELPGYVGLHVHSVVQGESSCSDKWILFREILETVPNDHNPLDTQI